MAKPGWKYVKIDVATLRHPRFDGLSSDAVVTWLALVLYSGENLTDGFVRDTVLRRTGRAKSRAQLISNGLLIPVDGGVQIHDYLEHQKSRAEVQSSIERNRKAGYIRALRSKLAQQNAERNAERNAQQTLSKTPAHTDTEVYPPNPPDTGGNHAAGSSTPSGTSGARGGHHGQHANCRSCRTNPRGDTTPPPTPTPPPLERRPRRPNQDQINNRGATQARHAITQENPP